MEGKNRPAPNRGFILPVTDMEAAGEIAIAPPFAGDDRHTASHGGRFSLNEKILEEKGRNSTKNVE